MDEKIKRDLQSCMLAIIDCDEEENDEGLCSCAMFIGNTLQRYQRSVDALEKRATRQAAKIKQLRKALEEYADRNSWSDRNPWEWKDNYDTDTGNTVYGFTVARDTLESVKP